MRRRRLVERGSLATRGGDGRHLTLGHLPAARFDAHRLATIDFCKPGEVHSSLSDARLKWPTNVAPRRER